MTDAEARIIFEHIYDKGTTGLEKIHHETNENHVAYTLSISKNEQVKDSILSASIDKWHELGSFPMTLEDCKDNNFKGSKIVKLMTLKNDEMKKAMGLDVGVEKFLESMLSPHNDINLNIVSDSLQLVKG